MGAQKDFFNQLDAVIAGKQVASAKEELTSESSTQDFIEVLSRYGADFIKQNRGAFDADDEKAIQELAAAIRKEEVQEQMLSYLQAPEEEEQPKEEQPEQVSSDAPAEGSDDLVSDDVIQLLEEE